MQYRCKSTAAECDGNLGRERYHRNHTEAVIVGSRVDHQTPPNAVPSLLTQPMPGFGRAFYCHLTVSVSDQRGGLGLGAVSEGIACRGENRPTRHIFSME